ncbi:MAG TPA: FlgD immunoglobulin-like domain containing protein [Ignavibacteriaceae bacterium]|nr:FlgD immunoglobulin-like domain containing protein [Ignavibacteriaceae bacterium]
MRLLFVCCMLLFISSFLFAQQNTFNTDVELQRFFDKGGKYEEINPGLFKLTYPNGYNKKVFFTPPKSIKENSNSKNINTTIINVWEIDTTEFAGMFKFWQRVKIVNDTEGIVFIDDINKNGLLELYGLTKVNWPFGGQVEILEQDNQGIFHSIYAYDSTSIFVQAIGDINGDGIEEVHLRTTDTLNGKFYKADSLGALPTSFDFVFYYNPIGQINDLTFGDFDKNGKADCIFIDWPTVYIAEYDSSINNFVQCFNFQIQSFDCQVGFAIGDFNQDGKTEIVFGTALKKVYVIEVKGENEYQVVWQGNAPTYNAYMLTSTNDIDGNGKPEFWVGGQDHLTGISTFWAYESDDQNNYIPVASIELRYLVSLYTNYLQASDIDNDGKEELIINIGNYLIMLKFTGQPNQHSYEIIYIKVGELTEPTANFQPATIHDLNNDGRKDILIPMDKYVDPNTIVFSYVLVQDTVTSIIEGFVNAVYNYSLYQNYPNPFNSSTTIKFVIDKSENINLKVYDYLGKEIKTIINEYLPSGEKEITWNGKDNKGNTVSSGVYFIQITAGDYRQTIKAVLLK